MSEVLQFLFFDDNDMKQCGAGRIPKVEIPRVLIEFSVAQMEKLEPEPPNPNIDEQTIAILTSMKEWRARYLSNRISMEMDLVAWLTTKMGPVGLIIIEFNEWVKRCKYKIKS